MHAYLRFTQKALPQASVLLLIVAAVAAPAMATPIEAFRLDHPGTGPFPRFGKVVQIEGNRMLVTAPGANDGIGCAYIYELDGGEWLLAATLAPDDAPATAAFGESGALAGDYVLIGAPRHDGAGEDAGAAYVFKFDGSTWKQTRFLTPSDIAPGDLFGQTVAIGNAFAVISSYEAFPSGRLYVYEPGDTLIETPLEPSAESSIKEHFGYHLAASGPRILATSSTSFTAVIYMRSGNQWVEEQVIENTTPETTDINGLALDGTTAILAVYDAAVVFEYLNGSWAQTQVLQPRVGMSAAIHGDRIATDFRENTLHGLSWTRFDPQGESPIWIAESDFRPTDNPRSSRLTIALDDQWILYGTPSASSNQGAVYGFSLPFCRRGSVELASGKPIDVLFVNGSAGDLSRRVVAEEGDMILGALIDPPGGGNGRFFVHANAGSIDVTTPLPFDIGNLCFPVLTSQGAKPLAVWNNLGRRGDLGISQYFGSPIDDPEPAPTVFLLQPDGDPVHLPVGTEITLQGAIVDPSSNASKPLRTTNAVTLEIQ